MPTPQLGETWMGPLDGAIGIVSEVRGERVTFVSFTGVRHTVQWRRSIEDMWKKEKDASFTGKSCSKQGCTQYAMLSYWRPKMSEMFEIVCPFHAPRGIKLELFLGGGGASFSGSTCESCKVDGIEVFGELDRSQQSSTRLWTCRYCGKWWMIADLRPNQALTASTIPRNFHMENIEEKAPDPVRFVRTYMIRLRRVASEQLKGVQPKNYFDFILASDDDDNL